MSEISFSEIASVILTRENITLALSIFGSFGTAFAMFHNFFTNRKRLQMRIIGHRFGNTKTLLIYAAFDNKSRLPISITDINVKINDVCYPCIQPSIVAYEETEKINGVVTSHHEYMTLSLPLNLASLAGSSGYVCFEFPSNVFQPSSTQLTFSISTNRGRAIQRTLSLGPQLD